MNETTSVSLSRRQWLERYSAPALAAVWAADLLPLSASAQPVSPKPVESPQGSAGARVYDVRAYGATGDGVTLDTSAVQAAIDACSLEGGGTVLVPAGDFVIGTVDLKSHVTLHLTARGRLLGSSRK
ncbi:MAG: hypothetical protein JNN01_04590, partial [Opitutaceae bacterium]|nr:hypothetical protein [Opitutaceae bacterium]